MSAVAKKLARILGFVLLPIVVLLSFVKTDPTTTAKRSQSWGEVNYRHRALIGVALSLRNLIVAAASCGRFQGE